MTAGAREFHYNDQLQPYEESINPAGGGLYTKLITRQFETMPAPPNPIPLGLLVGRPKEVDVGVAGSPTADYVANYYYEWQTARPWRVTGPGLPAYGAQYHYLTGSDLVDRTDFKTTYTTTVASANRTFETNRDLLTAVENKFGTTTFSKYAYQNDALGRRTTKANSGAAFTAAHFDAYTYTNGAQPYDRSELNESHRRLGDPGNPGNPLPEDDFVYHYDHIGNRTEYTPGQQAQPTTYTANQLDQYTATANPAESFGYDLDGNLTGDASRLYTWDGENRLQTVTPSGTPQAGDTKLEFAYDYVGRRIEKQVWTWTGTSWGTSPTLHRRFVYDGWNVLLELDVLAGGTGVPPVKCKYTWGLDLSGTWQGAGGIGGLLAVYDTNGTPDNPGDDLKYAYFYDANGNVGQVVDIISTGGWTDSRMVARYEYDPYGGALVKAGPYADTNPFRFSTKYFDGETGLYYFGYRYYHPGLGRWISRDPIGQEGGSALYAFVGNSPTGVIDSLGLQESQPTTQSQPTTTQCSCCCCCAEDIELTFGPHDRGPKAWVFHDWIFTDGYVGHVFEGFVSYSWVKKPGTDCDFHVWERWVADGKEERPRQDYVPISPEGKEYVPGDAWRHRPPRPSDCSGEQSIQFWDAPSIDTNVFPNRTRELTIEIELVSGCQEVGACNCSRVVFTLVQTLEIRGGQWVNRPGSMHVRGAVCYR